MFYTFRELATQASGRRGCDLCYDRFNELPYLRLRGDYGTGKTRFLLTLGSICYKPIFASGASSVSPLFHMLDRFGGTLIVDEADFRFSDEKADLTKILNNGNVRGFPVLRSESKDGREFNPRAFQVFGPKIIAMRNHFDDAALESRFITETSGERRLRKDIPINLPARQREEAEALRNKLLMYRFRNYRSINATSGVLDPTLEPRINQIYSPLLGVMDEEEVAREALRQSARGNSARLQAERVASVDAHVLTVTRYIVDQSGKGAIPIKDISDLFIVKYGAEYGQVTNQWLGYEGGANWAIIASLIETAKLNGVDPHAWLTDTLTKLVNRWPAPRIDELMPWAFTKISA